MDSMTQIRRTVEDAAEQHQELGESGKRIGNIVEVIRQISEQTSLLALNASIEAAHAGEQGRGFAVVADEVSSLARRVGQSAKDIEDLIATIKEQTADAVRAMTAGTSERGERHGEGDRDARATSSRSSTWCRDRRRGAGAGHRLRRDRPQHGRGAEDRQRGVLVVGGGGDPGRGAAQAGDQARASVRGFNLDGVHDAPRAGRQLADAAGGAPGAAGVVVAAAGVAHGAQRDRRCATRSRHRRPDRGARRAPAASPGSSRPRAGERAKARGVRLGDYRKLLDGDAGELDALVEMLRVGETRFFRHAEQIEALRRSFIPALARRRPAGETVRAWSAGCATGEEAWTLAMLLADGLPDRDVRVLGSDLSEEALARARAGRYRAEAVADLEPALRRRWFVRRGRAEVEVAPALRERVTFERRNLVEGAAAGERGISSSAATCSCTSTPPRNAAWSTGSPRRSSTTASWSSATPSTAPCATSPACPSSPARSPPTPAPPRGSVGGEGGTKEPCREAQGEHRTPSAGPADTTRPPGGRAGDSCGSIGMATAAEVAIAVRAALAAGR
jgi:hypothetical protein